MSSDTWDCQEIGFEIPEPEKLTYFLETYCENELFELVATYPEKRTIIIKLTDVQKFSQGLEMAIVNRFSVIATILQKALSDVSLIKFNNSDIDVNKIEFQICNVPGMHKKAIRDLNEKDI
jgi:replicative DNA helicase Mcm